MSNHFKQAAACLAALCLLATPVSALAAPVATSADPTDMANSALQWVKGQQQPDGSFPGFGAGSTVDAALAIVARGQSLPDYAKNGKTPLDFLESKAAELAKTPGGAGKLLILVGTTKANPTSFGGVDLVMAILNSYNASNGQYGKDVIGHAFCMLGLNAVGKIAPEPAVAFLKSAQNSDGGWSYSGETGPGKSDTNTTAVAVQALVAAGESKDGPELKKALAYFQSQQNADGGFPYQKGGQSGSDSDVNSTAYVMQALTALGSDAGRPLDFLRSMQRPSGAFNWMASQPGDNAGATYQAIPALLDVTLISPSGSTASNGATPPDRTPKTGASEVGLVIAALAAALIVLSAGWLIRRATHS